MICTDDLNIIYVKEIGLDNDENYVYEFIFSDDHDGVFVEGWQEIPACNEQDITPDDDDISAVYEVRTDVKLILGQNNCCLSFMDIKDNIGALAYEDITEYDEYPDDRIIIHYGETFNEVSRKLIIRNIDLKLLNE